MCTANNYLEAWLEAHCRVIGNPVRLCQSDSVAMHLARWCTNRTGAIQYSLSYGLLNDAHLALHLAIDLGILQKAWVNHSCYQRWVRQQLACTYCPCCSKPKPASAPRARGSAKPSAFASYINGGIIHDGEHMFPSIHSSEKFIGGISKIRRVYWVWLAQLIGADNQEMWNWYKLSAQTWYRQIQVKIKLDICTLIRSLFSGISVVQLTKARPHEVWKR